MSYILEALRKSERARREMEAEPLVRLAATPVAPRRSPWKAVIVGVSVIANVGALVYFIGPHTSIGSQARKQSASEARMPPVTSRQDQAYPSAVSPHAARSEPTVKMFDTPRQLGAGLSKDKALPVPLAGKSSSGKPVSTAVPTRPPKEAPSKTRTAAPVNPAPPRIPGVPADAAPPLPVRSAATRIRPEPDLPRLSEPRDTGGDRFPNLKVNVYAYSARNDGDRFVIIRNRKYREGDRTEDGPVVRRIEEQGMTIEFEGQTYKVPRP